MSFLKMSLVLIFLFIAGCASTTRYVEGTSTAIGAYIPMDGSIYGAEIVSYLSGVKVVTTSNHVMNIQREFCASNNYFGIVHTIESTKTKVDVK